MWYLERHGKGDLKLVVGKGISLIKFFEEVAVLSYHASITWNDFKVSKYNHIHWLLLDVENTSVVVTTKVINISCLASP